MIALNDQVYDVLINRSVNVEGTNKNKSIAYNCDYK